MQTSVFCVCSSIVLMTYELSDALRMEGSNGGKRIKLDFIDLNTGMDEYHTSVA